jgi:ribosomal protein L37AE/L43A
LKTHMREVTTQGKPFEKQFQNHERNRCFSTMVQRVRASLWKENPTRGLKCRQHTFSFFFTPEFGFQTTLHNTHKASASQRERERVRERESQLCILQTASHFFY